eukprot:13791235-Alexandrium_andersonii.AAC.1
MSASLVGSEMCIRDSLKHFRSFWDRRASRGSAELRGAPESSEEHGSGPVSYTHLTLPTICSV